MAPPGWSIRIEKVQPAHYALPDGTTQPGLDWFVHMISGETSHRVVVHSTLSEDLTLHARSDREYHGEVVIQYLEDLLAEGWTPEQGGHLEVLIENPSGRPGRKPWWRFW